MLVIIAGLLVLTLIFKLLGKMREYGCLIKILIVLILWKSGLLLLLTRIFVAIIIWVSTKVLYYATELTDYFSHTIFFY